MASFPFSGLKKQFNKANQFMTERITGVEGTKLDNDFQEMERRTGKVFFRQFVALVVDHQTTASEVPSSNPASHLLIYHVFFSNIE